ncbi:MAG: hypothetical protein L3J84_03610 [Gammaproteobacteria bacterium]|nr:hypothetical protein [Gammaproteobacteria bacterium]
MQKIPGPQTDDWLQSFADNHVLFHLHDETFSTPHGATAILRNEQCAHQSFVIGNTLALQCHIEMTDVMVQEWTALYKDELTDPATSVQDQNEITENLKERSKGTLLALAATVNINNQTGNQDSPEGFLLDVRPAESTGMT